MYDEHVEYQQAIARAKAVDPTLAEELSSRWEDRDRVNTRLARRLKQVAGLKGFTGELKVGVREGVQRDLTANAISRPAWMTTLNVEVAQSDWVDVDDDEDNDDVVLPPNDTEEAEEIVGFLDRLELIDT